VCILSSHCEIEAFFSELDVFLITLIFVPFFASVHCLGGDLYACMHGWRGTWMGDWNCVSDVRCIARYFVVPVLVDCDGRGLEGYA
jgi:hypothetical protein